MGIKQMINNKNLPKYLWLIVSKQGIYPIAFYGRTYCFLHKYQAECELKLFPHPNKYKVIKIKLNVAK